MDKMRFEVAKMDSIGKTRLFYYTGQLVKEDDKYVTIETERDGVLIFRREQIQSISVIDEMRQDGKKQYT